MLPAKWRQEDVGTVTVVVMKVKKKKKKKGFIKHLRGKLQVFFFIRIFTFILVKLTSVSWTDEDKTRSQFLRKKHKQQQQKKDLEVWSDLTTGYSEQWPELGKRKRKKKSSIQINNWMAIREQMNKWLHRFFERPVIWYYCSWCVKLKACRPDSVNSPPPNLALLCAFLPCVTNALPCPCFFSSLKKKLEGASIFVTPWNWDRTSAPCTSVSTFLATFLDWRIQYVQYITCELKICFQRHNFSLQGLYVPKGTYSLKPIILLFYVNVQ